MQVTKIINKGGFRPKIFVPLLGEHLGWLLGPMSLYHPWSLKPPLPCAQASNFSDPH